MSSGAGAAQTLGGVSLPPGTPVTNAGASSANIGLQQLIQAQQAMLAALPAAIQAGFAGVGQKVGAAAASGGGGGGGGGSGYFDRWGQITRIFGVGYGLRELFSGYNAAQTMNAGMIQAGGNQAAQARAQLGFAANVGGMFFGLGDILTGGREHRATTERILNDAEDQSRVDEARSGGATFRHRFGFEASQTTAGSDYARQKLQVQERTYQRTQEILAAREAEMKPITEQQKNRHAALQEAANRSIANMPEYTEVHLGPNQKEYTEAQKNAIKRNEVRAQMLANPTDEQKALTEFESEMSHANRATNLKYDRSIQQSAQRDMRERFDIGNDRRFDIGILSTRAQAEGKRSEYKFEEAERFQLHEENRLRREKEAGQLSESPLFNIIANLTGLDSIFRSVLGLGVPDSKRLALERAADKSEEDVVATRQKWRHEGALMGLGIHAAETAALLARDPVGARVAGIVGGALLSSFNLHDPADKPTRRAILQNAVGDLELQRQQYLDQFRAVSIGKFENLENPRDVENPATILKNIQDGIDQLTTAVKGLGSN